MDTPDTGKENLSAKVEIDQALLDALIKNTPDVISSKSVVEESKDEHNFRVKEKAWTKKDGKFVETDLEVESATTPDGLLEQTTTVYQGERGEGNQLMLIVQRKGSGTEANEGWKISVKDEKGSTLEWQSGYPVVSEESVNRFFVDGKETPNPDLPRHIVWLVGHNLFADNLFRIFDYTGGTRLGPGRRSILDSSDKLEVSRNYLRETSMPQVFSLVHGTLLVK